MYEQGLAVVIACIRGKQYCFQYYESKILQHICSARLTDEGGADDIVASNKSSCVFLFHVVIVLLLSANGA